MDRTIKDFVHSCTNCQAAKITRHTHSPIEVISSPTDRFQTILLDIVGPLPSASPPGNTDILP